MNLPVKHGDIKVPVKVPLLFAQLGFLLLELGFFFSGAGTLGILFFLIMIGFATVGKLSPTHVTIKSNRPEEPQLMSEEEEKALEADVFSDYDGFIQRVDAELHPQTCNNLDDCECLLVEEVVEPEPEPIKVIELIPASERLNPNQVITLTQVKCNWCKKRGHSYDNCEVYRSL